MTRYNPDSSIDVYEGDHAYSSYQEAVDREEDTRREKVSTLKTALTEQRAKTKLELESLIAQCYSEMRNLERFEDQRMLIATADLKYHFDAVDEAACDLEEAFDALKRVEND